jgi:predicted RNA-binding Zn-ribbon protein involved in translation (DUF1610 family)
MDLQTNWKPPEGFEQIESKLAGVVVYAPKKFVVTLPDQLTFKCPQCGGDTAYDPTAGSVICAHCGFQQALAADVVGRGAQGSEFTLETLQGQARGWGLARRELHCEACGADLSLEPTQISSRCPFCGSNQVINRQPTADGLRPGYLIPFKLDAATCQQRARDWLGKGWMFPKELSGAGNSALTQGIYLPFWTFSAHIHAAWEAQVGYERTESYYDAGAKAWRTRVVIDWRWQKGSVGVPVQDMLEPGMKNVSLRLLGKINPFDLGGLVAYEAEFLAGWQAKNYDIPLQPAWDSAKTRMREQAKTACYTDIPTPHVRSFSMAADFEDESWRLILLPVYLSTYRYQDKPYQVMLNGQTGKIAGQKPVAWGKVWLAILALLCPGLVIGLVGILLQAAGSDAGIGLIFGIGLFIVGMVVSIFILIQAFQAGEGS